MKKLLAIFTALILCFLLASCSSGAGGYPMADNSASSATASTENTTGGAEGVGDGSQNVTVENNRKIIEYITFYVQTKDFDTLVEGVSQQVSQCGGYVESSEISGNDYHSAGKRRASLVIRVPSEKSGEFSSYVSDNSTVTQREVRTEDVTLNYVDMESRIAALKIEKESLEKLLREAADLTDLFSIQERLTDVIYKIESYESQLRTYDNLIDYTTVTVYISEVERVAAAQDQSIWQEIGTNLSNNVQDIGAFFTALFVWLASALPYLAVLAVIAVIVILIVRRCQKHRKKRPTTTGYPYPPASMYPQAPMPPTPSNTSPVPPQEQPPAPKDTNG